MKRRKLPKKFSMGALARADRRALPVRFVLEGAQQILEDRGGADMASLLLQRAAHRVMHLDQMLAELELLRTQGKEIDAALYVKGAQAWLRYAQAIGLTRNAKNATPVLGEYMAAKSGRQSAEAPSAS